MLLVATAVLWFAPFVRQRAILGLEISGRALQGFASAIVWTTALAVLVDTVGQEELGGSLSCSIPRCMLTISRVCWLHWSGTESGKRRWPGSGWSGLRVRRRARRFRPLHGRYWGRRRAPFDHGRETKKALRGYDAQSQP